MCPHTTDCIGFCEVLIHDKIPLFKEYFKISRWLWGKAVKSRLLIHWHVPGPFLLLFTSHSITCPPPLPSVPLQTPDKSVFYFHSCALGNHITRHLHKEFHTVHPKAGEIWWHHLICDQLASQESECQKQSTNHVLLLKRNIFEREKNTCAKWLFGWPPRNLLHFQYYGALFDL